MRYVKLAKMSNLLFIGVAGRFCLNTKSCT